MFSLISPAKINLYLHITGKRADGYHLLDSLVTFTDFGDEISFAPSSTFTFTVDGPYASAFSASDLSTSPDSGNLVVRAAYALSHASGHELKADIRLTKNLPLGSGIGGGSSNAATCLAGLARLWNLKDADSSSIAATLGSDVPVCLPPHSGKRMQGVGEMVTAFDVPQLNLLLVNPNIPCPTPAVYKNLNLTNFTQPSSPTTDNFIGFLKNKTQNDMTGAAIGLVPEIADMLKAIENQSGCQLARMSGSGATCFGIFEDLEKLEQSKNAIRTRHPGWWINA